MATLHVDSILIINVFPTTQLDNCYNLLHKNEKNSS